MPPPRAVPPDSIPPDQVFEGFGRCGFRVPRAAVSPWARTRYVSHRVYDRSSICKLVEAKRSWPAVTYRDDNANDMLDLRPARPAKASVSEPPPLAQPLLSADQATGTAVREFRTRHHTARWLNHRSPSTYPCRVE